MKITEKEWTVWIKPTANLKHFLRFVLDALKDAESEQDVNKRTEKMNKILNNLQKSLED